LLPLPGTLTAPGRKYSGGLQKPWQSKNGLNRNIPAHRLVCLKIGVGHLLPEIFPGLFTQNRWGEGSPTQNVYLIKSVGLLIGPPWSLILYDGGLNDRTK